MEIYYYKEGSTQLSGKFLGAALCLGYFDGVHLAHRRLFDEAKKNGRWGVLLFDRNIKDKGVLTTNKEKTDIIEALGADYIIVAEFSESFKSRTPSEFADFLKMLGVSLVVAGYDYRFGRDASGGAAELTRLSEERSISAKIVEAEAKDNEPIKSTRIREYIKNGQIKEANSLLGYSYTVSGRVEKGFQNGHLLGFPTANIAYDEAKLLPKDGVYAGRAYGKAAVINIGKNPTFQAEKRTLEVHIIGEDSELYGEILEVEFFEKIRGEIKFESKEELSKQIKRDVEFTEVHYGKENFN